ncbi:MAG: ABC transporter ATP-binding protein [Gammaproteobacteria bacterium]
MPPVLEIDRLDVRFATPDGEVRAVHDVSLALAAGESLGVVGESGAGKTQTFLAALGLLAGNGSASGRVRVQGEDILNLPPARLNAIRGVRISMIFQDPMTALNPYLRVSRQLREVLTEHRGMSARAADQRAIAMLERAGIADAARRYRLYPHEFSGGMRQRVMIAMALLCEPAVLIADEPTTALDVTVQAQILALLRELKRDLKMAIVLITHNLGVVAGLCERVGVMYAGRIVETGAARDVFHHPLHPYTEGLLRSTPRLDEIRSMELAAIPGQPPNLQHLPPGCPFAPRCTHRFARCEHEPPAPREIAPGHSFACHLERSV